MMLPFQVISKDYVRSLFWGHGGEQKMVSELRENVAWRIFSAIQNYTVSENKGRRNKYRREYGP